MGSALVEVIFIDFFEFTDFSFNGIDLSFVFVCGLFSVEWFR